ncbi:MAG TPA: hypothetical protein VGG41_10955 [Solirubrobacteraceae bacterium]
MLWSVEIDRWRSYDEGGAIAPFAVAYTDQTQRDYLTCASTVGAASTSGTNGAGGLGGERSRAPQSSGAT